MLRPFAKNTQKKKEMTSSAILLVLLCIGLSAAVTPVAWGPVHSHTEIQFSLNAPGYVQRKEFSYDFPQLSLRVDGSYLSGPAEYELFNITSWWINSTLTMLTFIGDLPTCTQLDMGFGMMVPDWFLFGATTMEPGLWLTRQYNKSDAWYYRNVWTRKSAMPDGYFNYFSFNDTGAPFRMNAPSPAGEVVNEYYDFKNVTGFPAGTFATPAKCVLEKMSAATSVGSFAEQLHGIMASKRMPLAAAELTVQHAAQLFMMGRA